MLNIINIVNMKYNAFMSEILINFRFQNKHTLCSHVFFYVQKFVLYI